MVYSSLVNKAHAMLVITSLEHILNDPPPPPPPLKIAIIYVNH